MNRFIYYLLIIRMISSIATTVPKILLEQSKSGALASMILGTLIGLILTYVIIRFFNKFPGKDLPELMKKSMPKWVFYPIIFFFFLVMYAAGTAKLITFTFILVTFLTPEMALITMALPFLLIGAYVTLMKTENVLYSVEVIFILFIPLGIFIFIKAFIHENINWDYIKIAIMHANHLPQYNPFTATLSIFLGVASLMIFNKYVVVKQAIGMKHMAAIGFLSLLTLFITYFMPLGFGGFDDIDKLLYPWISTSDSIRMKLGLIERLIFLFMLLFASMSLLNIAIQWHIAAQLLGKIIYVKRFKWKSKNLTPFLIAFVFSLIAGILSNNFTEHDLHTFAITINNILPLFFFILLLSMWAVKRGAKS
ncbi:GerAB/ArcD/ProY family transporter [Sporosarcina sp. FA9]|uniref:GerAB/ArcD/ProY family transporter n=1 Tax=Sporosarcina sp. FA9 TaxID=3413030 RepID=UPI003F65CA8F